MPSPLPERRWQPGAWQALAHPSDDVYTTLEALARRPVSP